LTFFVTAPVASEPRGGKPPPGHKPAARTDRFGDPLPDQAIARLGTVRLRHPFWVRELAFAADDRTLFSVGEHPTGIRQWDLATGKELRRLDGPAKESSVAAVSPEAHAVAWVDQGMIRLQDLTTGKMLRELPAGDVNAFAVAFSPDGKRLASGGRDGAVRLWDVGTGLELRRYKGHARSVARVAFSPDGNRLASGSIASTLRLWDVATGRELHRLEVPTPMNFALTFSPDGKQLASVHDERAIRLWDTTAGKELRRIAVPGVRTFALQFSADGKRLASGGFGEKCVRLWDVSTGKLIRELAARAHGIWLLKLSHDGKVLAAVGRGGLIRLWDPATGRPAGPVEEDQDWVMGVAFSPDGTRVATGGRDATVRLWDAATGELLLRGRGAEEYVRRVCFAPDGRVLAAAGWGRSLSLWDVAMGKELYAVEGDPSAAWTLVFSPDGRTLAFAGYQDHAIRLWDVIARKETRRLAAEGLVEALAFSADGKALHSSETRYPIQGSMVRAWDVATGKELRRWPIPDAEGVFSADGRALVTRYAAALRLWDVAAGRERRSLPLPEGNPPGSIVGWATALSPDGRTVAYGGSTHDSVRLLEVATGAERVRLDGHQSHIVALAFSRDGRRLVSGSYDTTALVWDLTGCDGIGRPRPKLSAEALDRLWDDLAGADGVRAYRAIWRLAADPESAVPYARQRLRPAPPADAARLARLIADLDSKRFAVRQRAAQDLEDLDDLAEPALRRALEDNRSLEFRRRVEDILRKRTGPVAAPEKRRAFRAVEMLEYAGAPAARDLLGELSKGAPEARLTQEAKASLEQMTRRLPGKP
jgi:WD40 repeat protein